MTRKSKLIIAICLVAEAFTSLILSFVYSGNKKGLSKTFLGIGILSGLGGAYLLYNEYQEAKNDQLAFESDDWCSDDCDCCDHDFFNEQSADDINFTIAEEEAPTEE